MEPKTARLTVSIDPAKKAAFERLCTRRDLMSSRVVRQLILDRLAHQGVSDRHSGRQQDEDGAPSKPPGRR